MTGNRCNLRLKLLKRKSHSRIKILQRISLYLRLVSLLVFCIILKINLIILYEQFNFGLAPRTFGLVTSSNSLPEGQPHPFIFVSRCLPIHYGVFDLFGPLQIFQILLIWVVFEAPILTQYLENKPNSL